MRVDHGIYTVRPGDDALSIANVLLGDVRKAPEILRASGGVLQPGARIEVPGFYGHTAVVREGDAFSLLYQRVFASLPTESARTDFFLWNGGPRALEAGEEVFFVDGRRKSSGF